MRCRRTIRYMTERNLKQKFHHHKNIKTCRKMNAKPCAQFPPFRANDSFNNTGASWLHILGQTLLNWGNHLGSPQLSQSLNEWKVNRTLWSCIQGHWKVFQCSQPWSSRQPASTPQCSWQVIFSRWGNGMPKDCRLQALNMCETNE